MTEDVYQDAEKPTKTEQDTFNRLMHIYNQSNAEEQLDLHIYQMSELPRFIPDKEDTEGVFQFVYNLAEGNLNISQPYFILDTKKHFYSQSWYEIYEILLEAEHELKLLENNTL